jgi:hypothetical protein
MWTIIIVVVIAIFVANLYEYKYGYRSESFDYLAITLIGIIVGFVFGAIIALVLPVKSEVVKTTYYLEELQSNDASFLGIKRIDGEMKYVFYYERYGHYNLEEVDCDEAKIKFSNERPKAERFRKENVKDAFISNFAIDCNCHQEYIIYIPKGSIIQLAQ